MFAEDGDRMAHEPIGAERLLAEAARAAHGNRRRLASLVDLFLPDAMRLSDYQRVTVRRFIARLVAAVESDVRQRLVSEHAGRFSPELIAALGSARVAIAMPVLERARALHDIELVSLLLARVEEQRVADDLRRNAAANGEVSTLIEALLADADPALSAAAMSLLIAESRRYYVFDDETLPRSDLPADLHYRMVWWIAAALRDYMTRLHGADPMQVDTALMDVASTMLAAHDEGETLESSAMHLARLLGERGWLDDQVLRAACVEGRLALLIAILASRAGLDFDAARDMILPPYGDRLILLMKALDVERETAAAILLAMGPGDAGFSDAMNAYDTLAPAQAMDAIRPWQIDIGYRNAIAALATRLAERGSGWAA